MYDIFKNDHGVVVVVSGKGEQFIPPCGEDLLAIYQFETTKSFRTPEQNKAASQQLLEETFLGRKPVTAMFDRVSSGPIPTPAMA